MLVNLNTLVTRSNALCLIYFYFCIEHAAKGLQFFN